VGSQGIGSGRPKRLTVPVSSVHRRVGRGRASRVTASTFCTASTIAFKHRLSFRSPWWRCGAALMSISANVALDCDAFGPRIPDDPALRAHSWPRHQVSATTATPLVLHPHHLLPRGMPATLSRRNSWSLRVRTPAVKDGRAEHRRAFQIRSRDLAAVELVRPYRAA